MASVAAQVTLPPCRAANVEAWLVSQGWAPTGVKGAGGYLQAWAPLSPPCCSAGPGPESGVRTQFWMPDLRAWAWAWKTEKANGASPLRELFGAKEKNCAVGAGGRYELLFGLEFPRSQCFERALRSLRLVFCFLLLSRVSLGKLNHVCRLPLSLQSLSPAPRLLGALFYCEGSKERHPPPPRAHKVYVLHDAKSGHLWTPGNTSELGLLLCVHKTGRLPATGLQCQGQGARPQETLFVQREKIPNPFGLIPPHGFHTYSALQKPSRGSSIPQTFLTTCPVQRLVGAVAGEAAGLSPPETYSLAGKTYIKVIMTHWSKSEGVQSSWTPVLCSF